MARIWLGIEENEVVCYDEAGQRLGDYIAIANSLRDAERRVDEAEHRANAEAEARAAAERRATEEAEARINVEAQLRALEAELRRLRGN